MANWVNLGQQSSWGALNDCHAFPRASPSRAPQNSGWVPPHWSQWAFYRSLNDLGVWSHLIGIFTGRFPDVFWVSLVSYHSFESRFDTKSSLQSTRQVSLIPLPVIFSGSCRSFLASSLFLSNNAESRLWHRGCSSGGGCKASCFSKSPADSLWLGFLSRAASSNSLMEVLQSSAISSKGGACLCICWNEKRPWKQLFQKQWKRKSWITAWVVWEFPN